MKSKKRYSDRSWLKRSVLTFSRSLMMLFILILSGCAREDTIQAGYSDVPGEIYNHLTTSNYIRDIVNHPAFEGFGELLLPRDDNSRYYDTQLSNVGSIMSYHGHVEPAIVVDALNHMIDEVNNGETIFYDFYSSEQEQNDPNKENTGLFFYRGKQGAPFAIICPGGGFAYVGSLHEGFPLAQRISELGLNVFVIRYRIGSESDATEDLAAAIDYIFRNAETLGVDTADYSV